MAKVLVADDSPSILYLFKEFFKLKGFEVDTADNRLEANSKLIRNNYHLVILDIEMRRKQELEVLQNLTARSYKFPLIIFTSNEDLKEDLNVIAKRELDIELITKPPNLELLWNKAVYLLKKNAIREEPGRNN